PGAPSHRCGARAQYSGDLLGKHDLLAAGRAGGARNRHCLWRRALCGFALRGRWPGADLSRPARGHHINHCNRTEPMSAAPGIAVNDITVAYRNGTTALKHASFTSPRGSITALVGV